MSRITSGIGLISGLPIQDLVDQMMSIESRPVTQLQNRLGALNNRRGAFLQLSASLLALRNSALRFDSAGFFNAARATSSNENAIVATASTGAAIGQYTLRVLSTATSHHLLSNGYASSNASPIGAGVVTIETADALLNQSTPLGELRGGQGVSHGKIRFTDRAGGTATIDLSSASTLSDLVTLINEATGASLSARIEGDQLIVDDETGLATGSLVISNVGTGHAASDLGIAGTHSTGSATGASLVYLTDGTALADLNDGNGVRFKKGLDDFSVALADGTSLSYSLTANLAEDTPLAMLNGGTGIPAGGIKITNRAGQTVEIDLSAATTIGDVKTAIEGAGAGLSVTLSGARILVTDSSATTGTLTIAELDEGTTGKSLGLIGSVTDQTLTGKDIYSIRTIGDVMRLIAADTDNGGKLTAALSADGKGIELTDTTSGAATFAVTALNGSASADDLGILGPASGNTIASRRLLADLNTVLLRSLNGGQGVETGVIELFDRSGATATIDLSNAQSLTDVIAAINDAGIGVSATVSANGLGIEIADTTGAAGNLIVRDISGTAAEDLNIDVDAAVDQVKSGNLQKQYISASTTLASLRNGAGIPAGRFRITDSAGGTGIVDLTQGNEVTLQDVIDEINSRGIGVHARINDTGDGLLLEDTAGGAGKLTVAEDGSVTAKALRILGTSATGQTTINGTYETKVTIGGGDTLQDLVIKLRASGAPVNAAIVNDGTGSRPYRLNLTSSVSGRAGQLAIDSGATGLSLETLAAGRDAAVALGPTQSDSPVILTSSTNSIDGLIEGVKLNLIAENTQGVTVNVTSDADKITQDISTFVSAYNSVVTLIDNLTKFDTETNTASPLTGDATARRVRERLLTMINRTTGAPASGIDRLSDVGITFSAGVSLQFNAEKFKTAFAADPEAVQKLFTEAEKGFGVVFKSEIDRLTKTEDGVLAIEQTTLDQSEDRLNARITQLQTLLGRRRDRLLAQFSATESIIARLQSQQTALSNLSALSV
jgi:flagellar hook-associated protein 2